MYVHQQDWVSAIRVAENYEPAAVPDVYIAQARVKADASDHKAAEDLYILAARPELALVMYQVIDAVLFLTPSCPHCSLWNLILHLTTNYV